MPTKPTADPKFNFLTKHAANNVWAYPKQDNQSIQKPMRISPHGGFRNSFILQYRTIYLPEKAEKFHVYQIGQLTPDLIGLFPIENKWTRIDKICEDSQMIVDIFTGDGIMIPRVKSWYRWTDRRNLLIAVREVKSIPWNFNYEDLYVRVYSNVYFNILRRNLPEDFIKVKGYVLKQKSDIDDLISFKDEYSKKRGHLFIWVNGILRDDYYPSMTELGDTVEMLHDSTVYKKVSIKLTDTRTFDSLLDNKGKYLLSYPSDINNTIDYHDDIDFYIVNKNSDSYKGIYYHRLVGDSVRQVTHRDYSLVIPYVRKLIDNSTHTNEDRKVKQIFTNDQDIYFDYFIRRGMEDRNLIYNSHKLHELFKLPYEYRLNAMLGIRSNVDEWRADNLENGNYTKLISSPDVIYDSDIVEKAYGYHGISYISGYSPTLEKDFINNGNLNVVKLPVNLTKFSSHWEYNDRGILLTYGNHYYICSYTLKNNNTKMVEHISGLATDDVGSIYNQDSVIIPNDEEYRVYRVEKGKELKPNEWKDVTDNEETLFTLEKNKDTTTLKWLANNDYHTTMIRTDKQVLAYKVLKPLDNGIIDLFLTEVVTVNGQKIKMKMLVPRGHLDIYCNGHALVRNIDYFVDFPRVVITAKEYFKNVELGEKQEITVRFHGFCTKDLQILNPEQTGYVQFNRISYNKVFNLKEDKVLNFIIGGRVYDRSVLGFSEDNNEITITTRDKREIEGQPWQIKDIIVPMRNLTHEDTYTLRNRSIETDKRISDYMTQFLPESRSNNLPPIKKLYPLYSPFMSYILDDIRRGTFNFPKLEEHYNDQDVLDACKKYEWLLKLDPVHVDGAIDYNYVIVHPHPHYHAIDISIYQYKLFERINKLYMRGKVKLSHFIRKNQY